MNVDMRLGQMLQYVGGYVDFTSGHEFVLSPRLQGRIASSADPNVVLEVLNLLLSDEIPDQDIIYVLRVRGMSLEGSGTAVKWLKDNWERILAKYGGGLLLTNFISQIVPLVNSNEEADDNDIEAFFASRTNPSIIMNLNLSIEKIRIKARWIESVKKERTLPDLIKQLTQEMIALTSISY